METTKLLEKLRCGERLTLGEQLRLTVQLSIPAIFEIGRASCRERVLPRV